MLKAALILSWTATLCVIVWASSVVISVKSNPPAPSGWKKQEPCSENSYRNEQEAYALSNACRLTPAISRVANPPAVNIGSDGHARETGSHASERGSLAEIATAIIAFFALIVAVAQLIYFGTQLDYMRKSLHDARVSAGIAGVAAQAAKDSVTAMQVSDERQLRAYVEIYLREEGIFHQTDPFQITIDCENFGRTPAMRVSCRADFAVVLLPLPDTPIIQEITVPWHEDRLNLFPSSGEPSGFLKYDLKRKLFDEDYYGITKGKMGLVVAIEIKYLDVFGTAESNLHITRKCVCYTSKEKIRTIPGSSFAS